MKLTIHFHEPTIVPSLAQDRQPATTISFVRVTRTEIVNNIYRVYFENKANPHFPMKHDRHYLGTCPIPLQHIKSLQNDNDHQTY